MSFLNTKTTIDLAENIKLELKQGNYIVFFEIKHLIHDALAIAKFKPTAIFDILMKLQKVDLDLTGILKKDLDELKEFVGIAQAIWDIFLFLDTNKKLQEKFWDLISQAQLIEGESKTQCSVEILAKKQLLGRYYNIVFAILKQNYFVFMPTLTMKLKSK
jgi:hypothetical protein